MKEKDFTILVAYGIEHTANNINGTEKDRDLLSSAINPLIRILKDKEFISSYHSNLITGTVHSLDDRIIDALWGIHDRILDKDDKKTIRTAIDSFLNKDNSLSGQVTPYAKSEDIPESITNKAEAERVMKTALSSEGYVTISARDTAKKVLTKLAKRDKKGRELYEEVLNEEKRRKSYNLVKEEINVGTVDDLPDAMQKEEIEAEVENIEEEIKDILHAIQKKVK